MRGGRLMSALVVLTAAATGTTASSAQPLVPAMALRAFPSSAADVQRIHKAGVSVVRVPVDWSQIAPPTPPRSFEPSDPGDPAYTWSAADAAVTGAIAAGLRPILDVVGAPPWAAKAPATTTSTGYELGPSSPNTAALGEFATALATRYGGAYEDLPRVHYWQLYNEPNLDEDLRPQVVGGHDVAPGIYRSMVNSFAEAVHSVHIDNLVIVGGLTPFTFRNASGIHSIAPLKFMRELLCMSSGTHPHPTCPGTVEADVWSHHPYTSGGPTHKARNPGDVSLGDLPAMKRLLDAARAAGKLVSRKPPLFWVTEFSWDSSPPDSAAAPVSLLKRWVPQAMYQMWINGVSLVAWWTLTDEPRPSFVQAGLFFQNGKPKPYLQGFRFPVVAFPRGGGFFVWGRTPLGARATVTIQHRTNGGWKTVAVIRTAASGIFQRTFAGRRIGFVRAIVGKEASLPFSLANVPDRSYNAFGS